MRSAFQFIYQNKRKKLYYYPAHDHAYYEVVYFTKGSGVTRMLEQTFPYGPGDFTVTCPGVMRDEENQEVTDSWCAGFTLNEKLYHLRSGVFHDTKDKRILRLMLALRNEFVGKQENYVEMLELYTLQLVIEMQRLQNTDPRYDEFDKVIKMIEDNFEKGIKVEELAAMTNYSYHHFRHLFKKITGLSPTNYIINRRIEQAKTMLTEGIYKISEVSRACGFSTDAQFHLLFQKHVGMPPGQYKKIHAAGSREKKMTVFDED